MTSPYGQAVVPASRSAVRDDEGELTTIGISGPIGSGLSRSVSLQSCLENRLRARMASSGSTLFRLTWKARITPLGRQICALRASVRRTYANEATSWPTPTTRDHKDGDAQSCQNVPINALLGRAVHLAGWPTPDTGQGGPATPELIERRKLAGQKTTVRLSATANLVGWPTTQTSDATEGGQAARAMGATRHGSNLNDFVMLAASGSTPTGSLVVTASGGQLNPAHSRWLMGLPPEWDDCAVTAMPSLRRSPRRSSKPTRM